MDVLLEIIATKALAATLLAAAVALATRLIKRPGAVHGLWLIVLLELLAPPVLRVGVLQRPALAPPSGRDGRVLAEPLARVVQDPRPPSESAPAIARRGSPSPNGPAAAPAHRESAAAPVSKASSSEAPAAFATGSPAIATAPMREPPRSCREMDRPRETLRTPTGGSAEIPTRTLPGDLAARPGGGLRGADHARQDRLSGALQSLAPGILIVWLAGAMAVLTLAWLRWRRFARSLRRASEAPSDLREKAARLASRVGLSRPPACRVVEARVPPMVWLHGGRAEILFPAALVERLDDREQEALLLHELAHVARRDHWVRFVELAATSAFWWHPVAWWARRRLRRAEERACDARVVAALPGHGHVYARAVLETVLFLDGRPRAASALTTGLGAFRDFEERLTMILRERTSKLAPRSQRWAFAAGAVALLLVFPTWAERDSKTARAAGASSASGLAATSGPDVDTTPGPSVTATASGRSLTGAASAPSLIATASGRSLTGSASAPSLTATASGRSLTAVTSGTSLIATTPGPGEAAGPSLAATTPDPGLFAGASRPVTAAIPGSTATIAAAATPASDPEEAEPSGLFDEGEPADEAPRKRLASRERGEREEGLQALLARAAAIEEEIRELHARHSELLDELNRLLGAEGAEPDGEMGHDERLRKRSGNPAGSEELLPRQLFEERSSPSPRVREKREREEMLAQQARIESQREQLQHEHERLEGSLLEAKTKLREELLALRSRMNGSASRGATDEKAALERQAESLQRLLESQSSSVQGRSAEIERALRALEVESLRMKRAAGLARDPQVAQQVEQELRLAELELARAHARTEEEARALRRAVAAVKSQKGLDGVRRSGGKDDAMARELRELRERIEALQRSVEDRNEPGYE